MILKINFRPSIFFLFFLFVSYLKSNGQNLDSLMGIQAHADPQEKLYFQFDKSYYSPGEVIWYKTYVFRGNLLTTSSKNLYLEWVDENGKISKKFSAPIIQSQAWGLMSIPFDYARESIFFRAYTISMLNGDTSFLYTKSIPIILPAVNQNNTPVLSKDSGNKIVETKPNGTSSLSVLPLRSSKQSLDSNFVLHFYPEGGDLVEDLLSIVAFRFYNSQGLPFMGKGEITTEKGEHIVNFSAVHDGMGSLVLLPKAGEVYYANWMNARGILQKTKLPIAKSKGIVLRILPVTGGKRFTIVRSQEISDNFKNLYIVGSLNQQVVYLAKVNLKDQSGTLGNIPTLTLPSGILQVTVLDSHFKPLAERVCFINNHDFDFTAEISLLKPNKQRRGLNEGTIQVPGNSSASFSLAITDADLNLRSHLEDNLISHLLLTADLRGKIINPYYYFQNKSDSIAQALDYVMLTHGWRRYNWELLMRGLALQGPEKESNYISLNGKIAGIRNPAEYEGVKMNFILKAGDSTNDFLTIPLNKKGELFYDGLIFYGFAKIFFQPNGPRLQFDPSQLYINNGLYLSPNQAKINPENRYYSLINDPEVYQKYTSNTLQRQRVDYSRAQTEINLKEVVVKERAISNTQKLEKIYGTGLFAGGDSRNFDVENDPFAQGAFNIFQYLQSRVPGLQISGAETGNPNLSWRGSIPSIYLDGSKTQADALTSLSLSNIAYVKVYDPGSAGVISNTGGGAIAIFTKKGGSEKVEVPGMSSLRLSGYSPYKEFSAPDYATGLVDNLPDFRPTLYWNPKLFLPAGKHLLHFQFYNNDITRHFRIVLEGVNNQSKLLSIEKVY